MLFKYFGPLLSLMVFLVGCVLVQESEPAVEQAVPQFPAHLIQRVPPGDSRPLMERQLAYCEHPHESELVPEHTWRVKVGAALADTNTIDGFYVDPLHPHAKTSPMGCSSYPPGDLGASLWGLEWSPDGRELLYTFGDGSNTLVARAMVGPSGQTTAVSGLLNPPKYTTYDVAHAPAWSPDGSQIAFISQFQEGPVETGERLFAPSIFVVESDGSNPRYFIQEDRLPGIVGYPSWSHGSDRVAYVLRVPANGIGIIDVESGNVTRLDANTVAAIPQGVTDRNEFVAVRSLAWFPGDNLIAFLTNSESETDDILWVMEPDGSTPIQLYRGQIKQVALSPDGQTLVIVESDGRGAYVIRRFALETTVRSSEVLNTRSWEMARGNGVILRDIAWSTDGRYLAFASNATGDFDLFVWEVASGEITQLTDTPDLDEIAPVWRPVLDGG